ncbi:MAG: 2-C-methyl-D-erythritol 2,4-cyclodiphosphate synthase [Dehalococcoidia bacterium]|nr:2-C-methyl-D-erythritol 2,4-cyclodiphosphate synthase [Dehalococcoidia bacterium]
MRVGIGFDVHPLEAGRKLVLAGVDIPFEKGLAGHSDGDALTHAVVDALLGAAALGDIGTHFPSSDPRYRAVRSLLLLERVAGMLRDKGWRIENVDATIVAERPRLTPFVEAMRKGLGAALDLPIDRVGVKAKTTDGLGYAGRGEGITAYAVALLEQAS